MSRIAHVFFHFTPDNVHFCSVWLKLKLVRDKGQRWTNDIKLTYVLSIGDNTQIATSQSKSQLR